MLPKTGRNLPPWTGVLSGREIYAQTIADLLRKEHGDSHRAIKQLMRQTDASERAVKHWLSGQHGPDTVYFLRLVVSSPVLRAFVIGLMEGPLAASRRGTVDRDTLAKSREAYTAGEAGGSRTAVVARENVSERVPVNDPVNDPEGPELNERQYWFLDRVSEGRCSAKDLAKVWEVSLKTARRDVATLKAAALIGYFGSCRKGRYRRLLG